MRFTASKVVGAPPVTRFASRSMRPYGEAARFCSANGVPVAGDPRSGIVIVRPPFGNSLGGRPVAVPDGRPMVV